MIEPVGEPIPKSEEDKEKEKEEKEKAERQAKRNRLEGFFRANKENK